MELYITRHAETVWNLEGRLQGSMNSPLTKKGRIQSAQLGRRLAETAIDTVLTSPAERAMETARLIIGERKLPLQEVDALRELDMGMWEGRSIEELKRENEEALHRFLFDPYAKAAHGGENLLDLYERMLLAMEEIKRQYEGHTVLVVTHGVSQKMLLHPYSNRELADYVKNVRVLPQTNLCHIQIENGVERMLLYGDTSHYDIEL